MLRGSILETIQNQDELREVLDPVVSVKEIRLVRNYKESDYTNPMRDFAFIDCSTLEDA